MDTNTAAPAAEQGRIIMPHQRPAFDRLIEVATACFYTSRSSMPALALRTNSLLIGPSGSGKSFLAGEVAAHLGVPFYPISVADWVLMGCSERGGINTWPAIVRFLQANRRREGVVICLDELHHAWGDCAWERFLRVELFSLFDLKIPRGISAKLDNEDGERTFTDADIREVEDVLKNRTMIIGAGAFQGIWEKSTETPIGFHQKEPTLEMPTLRTLTETLPTELINRFRSELLILPPLTLPDYKLMLESSAQTIPSYLRETFLNLGHSRLPEVARLHQGTRFLEELLLDTILHERAALRNYQTPPLQLEFCFDDPSLDVDWTP